MVLNKKILIITMVFLAILSIPVIAQDAENVQEVVNQQSEEAAAYVNGEEISIQQLEQFAGVRNILMQLLQSNQEFASVILQTESGRNVIDEFKELKLEQLVTNELMVQEAKNRGIEVSEKEMSKVFDRLVNALKQQNNLNDEQLTQALQQQGFESMDKYKEVFFENNMNGFLINKLREEVISNLKITDEEAKEYYQNNKQRYETSEQKRISHILFDDQEKAKKVLNKIKNGADFAEMARENSTGPTAEKGGDLGFISKSNNNRLDKTFLNKAMEFEVGQISEKPLETQFGYHLIKMTDYKEAGVQSFEEVKSDIKNNLRAQKQNKKFKEFISDLREDAEIEIKL